MDLDLGERSAFVSGSTAGIGLAIARSLLQEGADVIINGRDERRVADAVAGLRAEFPRADVDGVAADFASDDEATALCDRLPDVDILVNNVGLFEQRAFADIDDAAWRHYIDVNVLSGVRLSRRMLPGMIDRGWGRVVFVSSESGVDVPGDMIHYGASKAAVAAIANGLAKLTRGTAVTVNTVLGGPTFSDGVAAAVTAVAAQSGLPVDDMKRAIIGTRTTTLLERFIEPDEIAAAVTYLASPRASATNGAAMRVDGGVLPTVY